MIKVDKNRLPSNRFFGFFMSLLMLLGSLFFYYNDWLIIFPIVLMLMCLLFAGVAISSPDKLLGLNRAWASIGIAMGAIFSPIVLAFIYFLLLAPCAIISRMLGRDELKLRQPAKVTYWIGVTSTPSTLDSFKQQF